jgi:O-antigen/teichoic acid export membrane protein
VSEASAPPQEVPQDVEALARGSGAIFVGGLVDKGTRLVTLWLLARGLGPAVFGVYTTATTVVTLAQLIAPLGADTGALLFASRQAHDRARLKGTIQTVALLAFAGGGLTTLALWIGGLSSAPPLGHALVIAAPAALVGALSAVIVGLLQAAGRFRAFVLGTLVVLPVSILVCSVAALAVGGLDAVLVAYVSGGAVALSVLVGFAWHQFRGLIADRTIRAQRDVPGLLSFSIPQSLSKVLWQFNLWTDVLMISWLATSEDVGIYRVALSIAMVGTLPVMALTTAMNPRAAALVHAGELVRLDRLLKVGTRTLFLLLAPLFVVLAALPELLLGFFDPVYVRGASALLVLIAGQTIYVLTGPTSSLLAMGGYARVNLINNVLTVALNVVLNMLLIPRMGILGAATATLVAQIAWATARTLEVRWLLRCVAFDLRSLALVAAGVGLVVALTFATPASSVPRVLATLVAAPAFLAVIWKLAAPEETEMLRAIVGRVRQRLAR